MSEAPDSTCSHSAGGAPVSRPRPALPLSFEAFHESHARRWLIYAHLHTGDPAAAEKIALATFQHLADHWQHVLRQPAVDSYAWAVLKQQLAQWLADRDQTTALARTAAFEAVNQALLSESRYGFSLLERRISLYTAISRLPERQCDAMVLRYVIGYPDDQIAAFLGVDTSAIRSRVSSIQRRLATELGVPQGPVEGG